MSFAVMTAFAVTLSVGSPTAQAQTTTAVDQSTFQQQLASANWALTEGMDNSLTFMENGGVSDATQSPISYGFTTATWNMSILFNDGTATVTAQTDWYPGIFDWLMTSAMGSSGPVESVLFGITYQALDAQSITISDIAVNGGTPLADSVFADPSNLFSGLSVNDDGTPITSITYDMSVYSANPDDPLTEIVPTMLSTVLVPEVATVPEPSTFGTILLGLGSLGTFAKRIKSEKI